MKLTRGNKPVFLFLMLLLSFTACRHVTEEQLLTGRWQYIKVLNNDTILFDIADTDHMELKADSTFHYEIAALHKVCNGKWGYNKDHALVLHYRQPDTTRYFDVEVVSARDLIITEGSRRFVLKRVQ